MPSVILFLLIACGALIYSGQVYTTGKQWYEGCYELQVEQTKAGWKEPTTTDPYKAQFWKQCERLSNLGIYNEGIIFAGLPKDESDTDGYALEKACPSAWKELPIGGSYMLTLKILLDQGHPDLIDKVSPAESMIGRAYKRRWPNCSAERVRQGYPKIVELSNGTFGWEKPCARCK